MIYQWTIILKEAGVDQLLAQLNDGLVPAYLEGTSMYLDDTFNVPACLEMPIKKPNLNAWLTALTEAGLDQLFDYINDGGTNTYMHTVALYLSENYEPPVYKKHVAGQLPNTDVTLSMLTQPLDPTESHELICAAPGLIVDVEFVAGDKGSFQNNLSKPVVVFPTIEKVG